MHLPRSGSHANATPNTSQIRQMRPERKKQDPSTASLASRPSEAFLVVFYFILFAFFLENDLNSSPSPLRICCVSPHNTPERVTSQCTPHRQGSAAPHLQQFSFIFVKQQALVSPLFSFYFLPALAAIKRDKNAVFLFSTVCFCSPFPPPLYSLYGEKAFSNQRDDGIFYLFISSHSVRAAQTI